MSVLRNANTNDFLIYKELLVDENTIYEWMFYNGDDKITEKNDYNIEEIEIYPNYSIEQFEHDIKDKTKRVLIIDLFGEIVGCVQLNYYNQTYYLSDWGMFRDNNSLKKIVIEELKKRYGKIKVNPYIDEARKFFLENSFIEDGFGFLNFKKLD